MRIMRAVALYALTPVVVATLIFLIPRARPATPYRRVDPDDSLYVAD